ncbi:MULTISPECIES: hypothetical protein [unclassified Imperialibacter]|uniref:hypothetical protein n=1 Tax=unclassified Imperialibacter TaxID=2629706 RepID=UPI0012542FBB|nr:MULTISPECIES: hypothetical protein [unclassified Imperialibacter]CAD5276393.1 conserved hypothetical protein [Imperialibacter sp. 75]CAD5294427.1 conserved hypothetical protein [Imperialibacter sp. 89]VVT12517.1 conserved hypothetical protein [Imperialibacter sp. EC-SDR9]
MNKFKLDDIEKKEPFEAPEKYFDEFSLRMQKRIEVKAAGSPVWQLLLSPKWSLSALAIVLMLGVGLFVWNNNKATDEDLNPLDAVATADLIYYLEIESVSADELVQLMDHAEAEDSIWNDGELNLLPEEEMTDEELLQLYDQLSTQDEIL